MSIFALAACSGTTSSTESAGSDGKATIALWTHNGGNDAELAVDKKIVDDFNASQTKYTVKLTSFPQASYNDAVVAAATAKKLPCVVDIDAPNVPNWAWAGYLAPLDLPKGTFDNQLPSTMGTIDKKVYSYGHYDVALAMYARKSVLDAAGIRIPTIDTPWTETEFADALATLKAAGQYPYALDLGTAGTGEWIPYAYSPFLQSFGGDLIDRDGYKSADGVLNGDEAIAWAEWMQGLVNDGYMAAKSGADSTADFVNGKSAILYSGSWASTTVAEAFGDDAVVIPPPDFGDGPKIGGGSWQWGMTTGCSSPAAASAYLEFAHQTKYFVDFSNTLGLIPATSDAAAEIPNYSAGGKDEIFLQMAKQYALIRPATPAYPYISSVFQKATQDILSGGDPKTILDKAVKDIDTDIKQNGEYAF
ncbi:MAG: sugar ABC transporter substrate-binding protein [Propionicimonas sp.]